MSTIYEYYQDDDDQPTQLDHADDRVAQTFKVISAYDISAVGLKLLKAGGTGTPGTITVSIRTTLAGEPTSTVLATGTTNGNTLTAVATGEWRIITFAAIASLETDGVYAIVISAPSSSDASQLRVRFDFANAAYANGELFTSADGEATWDAMDAGAATNDIMFRCYGGGLNAGTIPVDKKYSRQLVAISNNEVWYESPAGTMTELVAANNDIDTTDVLNVAEAFQKIFIANGANKKIADFVNTKLYDADVLTTKPTYGQLIYQAGADAAVMVVDFINGDASQDANYIYGKVISGTFETGTGITTEVAGAGDAIMTPDTVTAAPHWYDWTSYNNDETTYGAMPNVAYQVCRYRGRLQLCGDPSYPHQWYQSRQLNPYDFLYVAGDAQSPVAGNNADCSEVGDIVKVAIPYSDDYLIYGCASEIWVMSGDAAFGGELNPIDITTGILGDRAWCWDGEGNLYLMGTSGLLRIQKGFGQIENLTRELWPDFVEDLAFNSSTHRIVLAFNSEDSGIHIFKTTLATGACIGWWYDLRTNGLFPDAIPTAMGIYSAFYYKTEDPTYRKLLVGCADGYLKSFDKDTVNDDGTTITSYVGFAPLALSTHSRKDGIIKNIDMVTGIGDTDSDDVTCTVHIARTAAQIIKKLNDGDTAAFTKVFTAPNWSKSNLDRRSIRGQWAALVLTNSANTESWSMERLIVDSKEIGRSF